MTFKKRRTRSEGNAAAPVRALAVPVSAATPATRGGTFFRLIALLAAAVAVGGTALLLTPTAANAASPQDIVYTQQTRVVNRTRVPGEFSRSWTTCLHVAKSPIATTPACNYNVSVATHVEVSGGLTHGELSAGFGFSVTRTYSYGYGLGANVPAHMAGVIQAGVYFYRWKGVEQVRTCRSPGNTCTGWATVAHVTVEQAISPSMRFVQTAS